MWLTINHDDRFECVDPNTCVRKNGSIFFGRQNKRVFTILHAILSPLPFWKEN